MADNFLIEIKTFKNLKISHSELNRKQTNKRIKEKLMVRSFDNYWLVNQFTDIHSSNSIKHIIVITIKREKKLIHSTHKLKRIINK
jgi:hypothetical protein